MPARLFRVHLINNTSFPLNLVMGDGHVHGMFTSSEWSPPAQIPPRSEKGWQTESDGFMQGTNGHVVYDITGGERIKIEWTNPWWGQTDSTWTFQILTGFFDDRREGNSRRFTLQEMGPRPMGTHPGVIDTDKWLELMPGWFALPVPSGTLDHAWSAFLLNEADNTATTVPSFGPRTTAPLVFAPAEGAPFDVWKGTWVFPAGEESAARVHVQIRESAQAARFGMLRLHGSVYTVILSENSGIKEIAPILLQQDNVTETPSTNLVYRGDTWPPLVLPRRLRVSETTVSRTLTSLGAATLPPSPAALSLSGAAPDLQIRPEATGAVTPANFQGQADGSFGAIGSYYSTVGNHLASQVQKIKVLEQADSLVLDYDVTLMLYSVHVTDGQPLGYSVRYIRSSNGGRILADVMLMPAQAPIR